MTPPRVDAALDWIADRLSARPSVERERAEIAEVVDEASTLLPIDLVWLDGAETELREVVEREGVVLYERHPGLVAR